MMRPTRDRDTRVDVGGVPRVDLLPPDVRGRRRSRTVRRGLAAGVVAAILVSGAGVLGAGRLADDSAARLHAAQQRTAELLAEQRAYSEVSSTQSRLAAAAIARITVSTGKLDWRRYLRAVTATLPAGVRVKAVTVDTAAPTAPTTAPPITGPVAATLTFQVAGPSLAAVRTWLLALPTLPGFLDATPSAVTTPTDGGLLATVAIRVGPEAAKAAAVPASLPAPTSAAVPPPTETPGTTRAPTTSPTTPAPTASAAPRRSPAPKRTTAPAAGTTAPLAAGEGR